MSLKKSFIFFCLMITLLTPGCVAEQRPAVITSLTPETQSHLNSCEGAQVVYANLLTPITERCYFLETGALCEED